MGLEKNKTIDVVGIGGSLLDTLYVVPGYPEEDTKMKASQTVTQCGGPVATALTAVSKLGLSCSYVGVMGDDPAGRAMIADFKRYQVDTRFITVRPDSQSSTCIVIISEQKKTRTVIWSPGNTEPLAPEALPESVMNEARVLHLDGLQHDAAMAASRWFGENGKKVSLDAGSFHDRIELLLPYVDWMICAEDFVLQLTGQKSAEEAVCKTFQKYQPEVVAATQGPSGGVWTTDGKTVHHYNPAPVKEVDTTGAGDVFHGGVIYARLQGWDWPEVFRFASVTAALKCTKLGGRPGMPTRQEVDAYMSKQQGAEL